MAKMMTGGEMAPKKQGKIGEAIDRMRIGRKAKLEARSGAAADQGNAVKAKRLSNRAEKVGNRMELKAVKKGGVLPAGKKIGEYIGKVVSESKEKPMRKELDYDESTPYRATPEEMKKIMNDAQPFIPNEEQPFIPKEIRSRRLGKSMPIKG